MKDYLSGIISILASFQLLFVALFLFMHKKGNRRNNSILGLIFLLFSLSLGDFAIKDKWDRDSEPGFTSYR